MKGVLRLGLDSHREGDLAELIRRNWGMYSEVLGELGAELQGCEQRLELVRMLEEGFRKKQETYKTKVEFMSHIGVIKDDYL